MNWIGCQDSIEDNSGGQSSIGGRGGKVQGMCCICGASRKDKYMWGLVDSTQAKTTTHAPMSIEICMTYMIWSWAGHYSYMPRIVTLFGIRHSGHKLLQADWHIYIYIYIRLPNIRCCHMHFCWTHSSQPEKHAERKPRIIDNDNSFRSGKSEVRYGELWYLSPRSMVTWVSTYGPKIDQILRVYAWEMPCLKAHIWGISSAE